VYSFCFSYKKPQYDEEGDRLYETFRQKKEKILKAIHRSFCDTRKVKRTLSDSEFGLLDSDEED